MAKKKRVPFSLTEKIIILLCLIVFCGSGAYLIDYLLDNYRAQDDMKKISVEKEKGFEKVYDSNNDLIGWVKVDGTRIDYPVMQTRNKPEFYLRKDFHKNYSLAGTPFMDAASNVSGSPHSDGSRSTCNWLIYGHNMKWGIMFHDLMKYEKESFYREHSTFEFSTVKKDKDTGKVKESRSTYQIIAVCFSQIYAEDSTKFKYYQYASFTSEGDFEDYIAGIKAESVYEIGETAEYGEQLVTLSTCAYHTDNGRFYVVGKRIK